VQAVSNDKLANKVNAGLAVEDGEMAEEITAVSGSDNAVEEVSYLHNEFQS